MYPVVRFAKEMALHGFGPALGPGEVLITRHICWPWDVDPWLELNNGRTLTLYDLGRLPLMARLGLVGVMRRRRWMMTVAGASVRYRRRVRMFQRLTMRSALVGWDARFFYLEQSMWRGGEATSALLCRLAVTPGMGRGILPPAEAVADLGWPATSPPLPAHLQDWIAAETGRPWPPGPAA